jgi:hypothetical protein
MAVNGGDAARDLALDPLHFRASPERVYTPAELNGRSVTWVTPTFFFGRPLPE